MNADAIITNSTINGCSAVKGGGIFIDSTSSSLFDHTTSRFTMISANTATDGAGIYVKLDKSNSVQLYNLQVGSNIASGKGGGFYVEISSGTANVTASNCVFYPNAASSGREVFAEQSSGLGFYSFHLTRSRLFVPRSANSFKGSVHFFPDNEWMLSSGSNITYHVAPSGNDLFIGSIDRPLLTFVRVVAIAASFGDFDVAVIACCTKY